MMLKRNLLIWRFEEYWFDEAGYRASTADIVALRTHAEVLGSDCSIPEQTLLVALSPPLETILAGFDARAKTSIRQASKTIKVELAVSDEERELFYAAYRPFAKEKGLLIPNAAEEADLEIFLARSVEGKLLQAAAFLPAKSAGVYRYRYGIRIAKSQANAALMQAAMLRAKGLGFTQFDLGGISLGSKPDSKEGRINFFKSQFGGRLTPSRFYLRGSRISTKLLLKFLGATGLALRYQKLSALGARLAKSEK